MAISRRAALKGLLATGAVAAGGAKATAAVRPRRPPLPDAVGMLYDSTRCIGCKACVSACREANGLEPETRILDGAPYDAPIDLSARTKNVIKLYEGESGRAYMKSQCMHCVDPACVSVCMIGALHKIAGGVVAYDPDKCIGCRYCQIACPFNVPKFEWTKAAPKIVKCELCRTRLAAGREPACVEVCPRQAVIFGTRAQLLKAAHERIAANPDRYMPTVYGEHEAGGTQVLYLAGVPFTSLGLPELSDIPVPQLSESLQHAVYQGFIAPIGLYTALAIVLFRNRAAAGTVPDGEQEAQP